MMTAAFLAVGRIAFDIIIFSGKDHLSLYLHTVETLINSIRVLTRS